MDATEPLSQRGPEGARAARSSALILVAEGAPYSLVSGAENPDVQPINPMFSTNYSTLFRDLKRLACEAEAPAAEKPRPRSESKPRSSSAAKKQIEGRT